ncbi:CBS domain-containing protein [Mucilaginibacter auburnensis]|uniref:CBS domain-containing protein n=1 Tax=Mucilaginibacter auburnensis TaxID=1457233 RepID=UPI0012FD2B62|nr:CBS domain-containing protein [Mucilaginibacter auburnensis]
MSSHHIVREKQEPALLILGLDSFDQELLGQLLEWSPTVIADAPIAEQLNAMGIKVDRVLGNDVGDVMQSDVTYISVHGHTPLEAALILLIGENYSAVNVIADDFDLNDYIPFVSQINLVILHQNKKVYAVTSGFTKWLPAGEELTFLTQATDLISTGLSQQQNNKFTTTADGVIKLEFSNPFIFIAEAIS